MNDGVEAPFEDHFSGHAAAYATSRPSYPEALFDVLVDAAPGRSHAWDCATGNGQAAVALAADGRFDRVTATDASRTQLAHAIAHPRVAYRLAAAESSGLGDRTVDLVAVAQALHWFDLPAFSREARRVLRPGGVLAAWSYALCTVSPEVDAVVGRLYREIIGPYWPARRRLVEEGYASLDLPGEALPVPPIEMDVSWTLAEYRAYLATWSAVRRFLEARGADPIAEVDADLRSAWGDETLARRIAWPVSLRIHRIAG